MGDAYGVRSHGRQEQKPRHSQLNAATPEAVAEEGLFTFTLARRHYTFSARTFGIKRPVEDCNIRTTNTSKEEQGCVAGKGEETGADRMGIDGAKGQSPALKARAHPEVIGPSTSE
uniref:Uncharacterized protein n=1 Tax=Trichuris muris TaxID=70415 RepID=A0A5S6QDV7_TRIMR